MTWILTQDGDGLQTSENAASSLLEVGESVSESDVGEEHHVFALRYLMVLKHLCHHVSGTATHPIHLL